MPRSHRSRCLLTLAFLTGCAGNAGSGPGGAPAAAEPGAVPAALPAASPSGPPAVPTPYDFVLRGGTVYDGSGGAPRVADVGVRGDRIATIGDLDGATATLEVDARGLAVAPGFVNMLSWATESLLVDGRAMSDLKQGVTLEVFGEGVSMGPVNDRIRSEMVATQSDIRYDVTWGTLGEYLEHLERRGVAPNVASFVGATTLRVHEVGFEDRRATPEELARMVELVHAAMREGALGVGSSLIYAPAFYADTAELVALARAAGEHDGLYITHMRSEGNRLLEAVDEVLTIAREAGVRAEIYHLKAAGRENWGKIDALVAKVEAARAAGVAIGADMYTYTAGATGLDAAMPPWVQAGGLAAWIERLRDPATRDRVLAEMREPTDAWENLLLAAGGAENVLLVGFKSEALKPLTGRTLAEVAGARGKSPEETAIDLVVEDGSRVGTIYFLMSEDNVRRQIALPWVAFGSDAEAPAPEGVFLGSNPHPRAYGTFARLLGRYVRDEGVISLAEAVRRLTSLPAENLRLVDRGRLAPGYFADLAVFDPGAIADRATYQQPHQYAVGMRHVFVNGVQVLKRRRAHRRVARARRPRAGVAAGGWRDDDAVARRSVRAASAPRARFPQASSPAASRPRRWSTRTRTPSAAGWVCRGGRRAGPRTRR
jgi:N-acyl-D-amino-acid deacylase